MSIERFVFQGDDKFITITGGVDTAEVLEMSGEMKEHHFSIRFKDGSGADVVPTAGTVRLQGSGFRDPYYDEVCNGFFNAIDINDDARERPTVGGPLRAVKVTLDGVTGADSAIIKITSF